MLNRSSLCISFLSVVFVLILNVVNLNLTGISTRKFAISFPVYFIHASADDGKLLGLQGGIRLSYLTDTQNGNISSFNDGIGAQMIISAPFDISGSFKK
jgi:hypothetical protein